MEANVPVGTAADRLDHVVYFERMNTFAETSLEQSNSVTVIIKALTLPLFDALLNQKKEMTGLEGTRKPTSSK
jgi:hypothetical protein